MIGAPTVPAVGVAVAVLARLADAGTAPPTTQPATGSGQGPEWGEAAPVGLLIILLLAGGLFLLIKSMNRNLRRVPESFDDPVTEAAPAPAADPSPAADAASTTARDAADGSGEHPQAPAS